MLPKRRSGRFSLEENRELMLMALDGATIEAAAAKFGASPDTIAHKVAKFGIQMTSAVWVERQRAARTCPAARKLRHKQENLGRSKTTIGYGLAWQKDKQSG